MIARSRRIRAGCPTFELPSFDFSHQSSFLIGRSAFHVDRESARTTGKTPGNTGPRASTTREKPPSPAFWRLHLLDAGSIALFLALTFLLGAFPLKDTDFYWHLRTGDWIRQTGHVPRTDLFTFTREGIAWIDLHWLFQIAISWVYQQGGIVALTVAKCTITCVAMLLLLSARRREWPVWVIILAWLPALLVLGGRMYVRPETLTLLYLSIYLAILLRWDRRPWLALLLPLVQVAWVNSHGLFVLGPIVLGFGLIDAALRFGFFTPERRKWWRTILAATLLCGAACLLNPYFITGALYPLELAGTMSKKIFSQNIAELTPIPDFIRSAGLWNLPIAIALRDHDFGRSQLSDSPGLADRRTHDREPGNPCTTAQNPRKRSRRSPTRTETARDQRQRGRNGQRASQQRQRSLTSPRVGGSAHFGSCFTWRSRS